LRRHHGGSSSGQHVTIELAHGLFFFDEQHPPAYCALAPSHHYRSRRRFGCSHGMRSCGQPYFYYRAAVGSVVSRDVAAVLLHDAIADAQAKPRSLAHALSRVERIKDTLRILESGAIIGELGAHMP